MDETDLWGSVPDLSPPAPPPEEEGDFYEGRYLVIGPPGTGKTTFLGRQIQAVVERYQHSASVAARWSTPVMVCSLTRAAAAEVVGRGLPVARHAIGTLHAHCYRAMERPVVVEAAHIRTWNEDYPWPILGMDLSTGDEPEWDRHVADMPRDGGGDALLAQLELLRHKMVPRDAWSVAVADFEAAWSAFKDEQGVVDFTDLIETSLRHVDVAPNNPAVIMVDEAQDLSTLEYAVIRKWAERSRATIVVGDSWQALYTWRGADPEIFADNTVPDDHRRVLSQSYRVPERVLKVAKGWVEDHLSNYSPIEYKPRSKPVADEDPRGQVRVATSSIYDTGAIVEEAADYVEGGRSVMFQASCSFMLASLVSELRRRGLPFSNPWRQHRGDWNPLAPTSGTPMGGRAYAFVSNCYDVRERAWWTLGQVWLWANPLRVAGCLRRGAKPAIRVSAEGGMDSPVEGSLSGDLCTIDHITSWFMPDVVDDLIAIWKGDWSSEQAIDWWHQRLLAAPKESASYPLEVARKYGIEALSREPRIYVGTIHSFKGAEADVTYVFPDLSSAGFKQWQRGESLERDSVVRLFYVAMTRAREELVVCSAASSTCAPLRREVEVMAESIYREDDQDGQRQEKQ